MEAPRAESPHPINLGVGCHLRLIAPCHHVGADRTAAPFPAWPWMVAATPHTNIDLRFYPPLE